MFTVHISTVRITVIIIDRPTWRLTKGNSNLINHIFCEAISTLQLLLVEKSKRRWTMLPVEQYIQLNTCLIVHKSTHWPANFLVALRLIDIIL